MSSPRPATTSYHDMRLRSAAVLALTILYAAPIRAADFIQGIDVYHGDGAVDWETVKKEGIQFAFVKATEGDHFLDKRFDTNMKGATDAGIFVGPYHFCRINNKKG